MKKRHVVLISALALLVAVTVWGSWAYFTAEAHVTNVITTGNVRIVLNDEMEGAERLPDEERPTAVLTGVMPGQEVSKRVSVTNAGSGEAWVRLKVATTITGEDEEALPAVFSHGGEAESAVELSCQDTNWIEGKDGYYYYTQPLPAQSTTGDLFDAVTLNRFLPNQYENCTVDIAVSAQAVQAKNNTVDMAAGQSVLDVQGWPAQ